MGFRGKLARIARVAVYCFAVAFIVCVLYVWIGDAFFRPLIYP